MVGVPGRSKACLTCRRRRKGCDGTRPACSQCGAAGLECAGYARQTIFVNWTDGTSPAIYRRPDHTNGTNDSSSTIRYPPNTCPSPRNTSTTTTMEPLQHNLTRTAYVEQHTGLFWQQYLPHGRTSSPRSNSQCGSEGFLLVAETMHASHPAVQKVLLALSMSAIGRRDSDIALVQAGIRAYSRTVQNLAGMIASGAASMNSDVALILVKGLNTFEMLFGEDHTETVAQSRRLISHLEGEMAMLESRGPESVQMGDAHEMLVVGRLFLVGSTLRTRTRSFIHSTEWLTIPWLIIPKNARDRLVDITIEVAGLVEDIDTISAAKNSNRNNNNNNSQYHKMRHDTIQTCFQLDARLQNWFLSDAPSVEFFDPSTGGGRLRESWDPDDYARADMMQIYWSICLLLYELMHLITPTTPTTPTTTKTTDVNDIDDDNELTTPPLPARCDPTWYLRQIGLTLPMIWSRGAGILTATRGTFPMGMALYVLHSRLYTDPDLEAMFAELRARPDVRATLVGPFMDSLVAELVPRQAAVIRQLSSLGAEERGREMLQ